MPSEPKGRAAVWTDERGREERAPERGGKTAGQSAPEASEKHSYSCDHASVSTLRRICSISSKCSWVQVSGGASWMTGSPRSSARQ